MDWVRNYKDHLPALFAGTILGLSGGWLVAQYAHAERVAMLKEQIETNKAHIISLSEINKGNEQLNSNQKDQIANLKSQVLDLENRLSRSNFQPSLNALILQLENKIQFKKMEIRRSYGSMLRITAEGSTQPEKTIVTAELERELEDLTKQLSKARSKQLREAKP